MRRFLFALLLSACTGDFSVHLDESSSSSSPSATSIETTELSSTSSSSESSEAESTAADSSSETASVDPDTTSPDESSSSSSGCSEIETCVPCNELPESACGEAFVDRPVCDADSGLCMQCSDTNTSQCEGTTPVCAEGQCVACSFHEECPATACNASTGACFDDRCVRHVDGDGGQDYSTLSTALADGCVVLLHERDGDVPYNESLGISGLTIAILAAEGEHPVVQGIGGAPSILVEDDATVFLQQVRLRGNTGASGLSLIDSTVYVDNSQIIQNDGGGIVASGGELLVRNSFIGSNGGNSFSPTTGVAAEGTNLNIVYTTIAFNEGDGADSFQCTTTTGTLRNSIVVGSDPSSFDCPGVFADHTAFDDDVAGGGNVDVSPASGSWFVNPTSDFHLTVAGSAVFADLAEWTTGDPAVDIDGTEPRPNSDGAADVAGADVRP
jgi:hypothetical protein